ncbi:hypothetical protein C2G38_2234864 [Gigaspora rosea]|uniref:Uncharacterized protein n=1 Tax=Gigaspora rosea TaxID=44941 RepID=A0A397TS75_9GLOM|nr:hypothetical protein C2G38_2234864 [Gigaspora rosea]
MKKALNVALDLGCDDELINIINQFITEKVTKHHGRPTTKRLKSSSKSQSYKASTHSYHTINPQDSNLRIPLAPLVNNNSNDGHALAPLVNNDSNDGYALAPLVNNDSNGSNALNNNIESHVKKVKGDIYVILQCK